MVRNLLIPRDYPGAVPDSQGTARQGGEVAPISRGRDRSAGSRRREPMYNPPMKTLLRKSFAIAGLAILAACANPGGEASRPDPRTFQGATADSVIENFGPPQGDNHLPAGGRELLYSWTSSYVDGGYTSTLDSPIYSGSNLNLPRSYQPTRTVTTKCVVRFTLGADNRVSRVESFGDGC
jgi:hypothetical protein